MTNRNHQIRVKHEFYLLQKHVEIDPETNKKIILACIGLIIISLCLLFVIWSYIFSIHNFI
jgi:hypothetical protein